MTDVAQVRSLSIDTLIRERLRELGLRPADLIRRCGYANVAKGLRRLDQLRNGDFESAAGLLRRLPTGLDLPLGPVEYAVETSRREVAEAMRKMAEAEEAAWRNTFRPHAIILTERRQPEPIFVAGLIGVETLLQIDFDPIDDRASFQGQAIEGICSKLMRWNQSFDRGKGIGSFSLPAFGRPTGFVINYAVDLGARFDLEGRVLEILPKARRLGRATMSLKRKRVPPSLLRSTLGFG